MSSVRYHYSIVLLTEKLLPSDAVTRSYTRKKGFQFSPTPSACAKTLAQRWENDESTIDFITLRLYDDNGIVVLRTDKVNYDKGGKENSSLIIENQEWSSYTHPQSTYFEVHHFLTRVFDEQGFYPVLNVEEDLK